MASFPMIGKENIGAQKSDESFVGRSFFQRKHLKNEYLEPFPYKSWYKW